MIPVSAGAKIWIATGHTDMRKGMQDLALLVQEGLGRDPSAGDVIVFRGRAGTLIKAFGTTGSGCRSTPRDWRAVKFDCIEHSRNEVCCPLDDRVLQCN